MFRVVDTGSEPTLVPNHFPHPFGRPPSVHKKSTCHHHRRVWCKGFLVVWRMDVGHSTTIRLIWRDVSTRLVGVGALQGDSGTGLLQWLKGGECLISGLSVDIRSGKDYYRSGLTNWTRGRRGGSVGHVFKTFGRRRGTRVIYVVKRSLNICFGVQFRCVVESIRRVARIHQPCE